MSDTHILTVDNGSDVRLSTTFPASRSGHIKNPVESVSTPRGVSSARDSELLTCFGPESSQHLHHVSAERVICSKHDYCFAS